MDQIFPLEIKVPQADLADLQARLRQTRWPERETVDDWSQGAPLEKVQALCDYWRDWYDWRRCENALNHLGQFQTTIEELPIHFMHVRSPEANALPLIMTHGWPGSIIEFQKVIGPLTDPVAHGGRRHDAFHLILPSLPGYGFSGRPARSGWNVDHIATAWAELMRRLGYTRFVAQGGDWGSTVTTALAKLAPPALMAIHLNMPLVFPDAGELSGSDAAQQEAARRLDHFNLTESGYAQQQATRPQTLGYGLADSPAGQAAWIYEKLHAWTDCNDDPEGLLGRDEILDNITLYWLTGTATSSARLYWESMGSAFSDTTQIAIPTGCSIFPKEIFQPWRGLVERRYTNLIHWNALDVGGHFAAWEQPALFVNELRTCFRAIR